MVLVAFGDPLDGEEEGAGANIAHLGASRGYKAHQATG
jgi:hypothetical protein